VLDGLSRSSLPLDLVLEYCDGPLQPTDDDVFRMLPFGIESLYQAHGNVIHLLYVWVSCGNIFLGFAQKWILFLRHSIKFLVMLGLLIYYRDCLSDLSFSVVFLLAFPQNSYDHSSSISLPLNIRDVLTGK
jgi:hypothetical protein